MRQPDDDTRTGDQWIMHSSVISAAVTEWQAGEITLTEKRRRIADENQRYYGGERKSPVTGEQLARMPHRYDLALVIASGLGIAPEMADVALAGRRNGSFRYRQALDDGESREYALELDAEGLRAYHDVLKTAGVGSKPPEVPL